MPTHAVTAPEAGVMMTAEKEYAEIPQAEPESLRRSRPQNYRGLYSRFRLGAMRGIESL